MRDFAFVPPRVVAVVSDVVGGVLVAVVVVAVSVVVVVAAQLNFSPARKLVHSGHWQW